MKFRTGALALLLLAAQPALAAGEPQSLGHFGDWSAYTFMDGAGKVCFMSSVPKEQKGIGKKKRGDVMLFVTHWSGDGAKNVVSVSAGYSYKKDATVTVKVNGQTYKLFTEGEMAWTNDQKTDNALAEAMRKGSNVTVTGSSARGTETTDVYGLSGSGDAHDAITRACKM